MATDLRYLLSRTVVSALCLLGVACGKEAAKDDSPAAGTGAVAGTVAGTMPFTVPMAGTVAGTTATAGTGMPDAGPIGPGTCMLTEGSIRKTNVELGSTVLNNEDEAALQPVVISALASGGSRVAWMGDDAKLHIATLDQYDKLFGTPFTLEADSFADMLADDAGGAVLVSRPAQGSGDKQCGTLENLCGNASMLPAQYACRDMYLVRFRGPAESWAVNLTDSSAERPPYLTGPLDPQRVVYIWEAYAHHGRIAYDGSRYAAYFGAAISVSETCVQPDTSQATGVNIHQGDRMQLVDKFGALLDEGAGGFGWGCSHSGYERVVWDPAANRFVAVCKTDNQNRIAMAPNYATLRAVELRASNMSDLVASPTGNWLAFSDQEAGNPDLADVHLLRFTVAGDSATVEEEVPVAMQTGLNERAPHLANFGEGGLIVAWETSTAIGDLSPNDAERKLYVQARDSYSGDAMGEPVLVGGMRGNRYHSLRSFPDGSVAFIAPGTTNTSVTVVRMMPCPSRWEL